MIVLPPVFELSVVGVADAGTPNHERIILRPTEPINLAWYGIILGLKDTSTDVLTPLNDQFFWFGDREVAPPAWLVVYTGPGQPGESVIPGIDQKAYTFHWGRRYTVFGESSIVPIVFRFQGILSAETPATQVQKLLSGIGKIPETPEAGE